jgi:exonuclease VII small subunit
MITNEMIAYGRGYEDARRDEITACIQSLQEEAQRLSRALPELAEGIQIASEIIVNKFEARNPREIKVSKQAKKKTRHLI